MHDVPQVDVVGVEDGVADEQLAGARGRSVLVHVADEYGHAVLLAAGDRDAEALLVVAPQTHGAHVGHLFSSLLAASRQAARLVRELHLQLLFLRLLLLLWRWW